MPNYPSTCLVFLLQSLDSLQPPYVSLPYYFVTQVRSFRLLDLLDSPHLPPRSFVHSRMQACPGTRLVRLSIPRCSVCCLGRLDLLDLLLNRITYPLLQLWPVPKHKE